MNQESEKYRRGKDQGVAAKLIFKRLRTGILRIEIHSHRAHGHAEHGDRYHHKREVIPECHTENASEQDLVHQGSQRDHEHTAIGPFRGRNFSFHLLLFTRDLLVVAIPRLPRLLA